MNSPISLNITVDDGVLRVTVANIGKVRQRLWARTSSWGWSIFSLLLSTPRLEKWHEFTVEPIRWTRNIPKALDIPYRGQLIYELRCKDPDWKGLNAVETWLNEKLLVRVRLRVTKTPEAVSQSVFIGELLSPICESIPPHDWLCKK
jgi:hypothetical protein